MIEPTTGFNDGGRKLKPVREPPTDVIELFAAEDRRIAIWGRPYTGPVKNTKLKAEGK